MHQMHYENQVPRCQWRCQITRQRNAAQSEKDRQRQPQSVVAERRYRQQRQGKPAAATAMLLRISAPRVAPINIPSSR
ncbi:Uncharacterised protein [Klebsiella michiganensis]|uniref:Uncharacterized protein n=1 Tax=Klebsiella michiganensis TaxID=1134687 RepID=A0A7H4M217_9ENTR|nr:Uncharacterised protein [Klebsiella michiganensis]